MYTYLLLNIFTILFPLFRSFEPKIHYVRNWKYIFAAIVVTGSFFICWDHYFTQWKIWSFNEDYILGIYILSLPLEEWLFFITVPFACLFIYEVLKYFVPGDPLKRFVPAITLGLVILFSLVAVFNYEKRYTLVCFSFAAFGLALHYIMLKRRYLGMFFLTYIVHLIPFLLVNGLLTSLPVVQYNNTENLDMRILTIPIEDTVYSFILLLMNITFYELIKKAAGAQLKKRKEKAFLPIKDTKQFDVQ